MYRHEPRTPEAFPERSAGAGPPWGVLACPCCRVRLSRTGETASCPRCGARYEGGRGRPLDLRPPRDLVARAEFRVPPPSDGSVDRADAAVRRLSKCQRPDVDFANVPVPFHLDDILLSYFPQASGPDSLVLDLGCGTARHREVCEHAGFHYVGLDYDSPDATVLGDAHALPFDDGSFEFVLCVSVLEHVRFPFLAIAEAHRVLKPGGRLIGDVAFLESYHSHSFYHHSHLGIWNLLDYAGFEIDVIAPNPTWPALVAIACDGLFPKMPRPLARALVSPVESLHRAWWWAGAHLRDRTRVNEGIRVRNLSGSFSFIAHRPRTERAAPRSGAADD